MCRYCSNLFAIAEQKHTVGTYIRMSSPVSIIAVVTLLVAINGFYVVAEFSVVSAKRSRLAQMVDAGYVGARPLLAIISDPSRLDAYIAACQVGITLSSLLLGFYAQGQIINWADPYFANLVSPLRSILEPISSFVLLISLAIFQGLLGEFIPKNIGIQHPERLAVWTATPMRWSLIAFRPMIWLFNGSSRLLLRIFGATHVTEQTHVHSPEEIVFLVEESGAGGILDNTERRLLVNTLQLRNQTVRKVMVPRNRVLAASVDQPLAEIFQLLANSPYSRLPIYEGTIDRIVGIVHIKDLLQLYYWQQHPEEPGAQSQDLRQVLHEPLFVPDSIQIEEVIEQMQKVRQNIAIVVDEYGGTTGLLAFEDLLEEIIGDFQDEFDTENPDLRLVGKNHLLVRGDVQLDTLNLLLNCHFASEDVDTIGGLVATELGRIPTVGDRIEIDGTRIRVERMEDNRVAEVQLMLSPEQYARLQEMTNE